MTIISVILAAGLALAIVFLIGKASRVASLETENALLRRDCDKAPERYKE